MSPLRINEQTPASRLAEARQAVTEAGAQLDAAQAHLREFRETVAHLVRDEQIAAQERILIQECDACWEELQERISIVTFMRGEIAPRQINRRPPR